MKHGHHADKPCVPGIVGAGPPRAEVVPPAESPILFEHRRLDRLLERQAFPGVMLSGRRPMKGAPRLGRFQLRTFVPLLVKLPDGDSQLVQSQLPICDLGIEQTLIMTARRIPR
jgi:hypothetical protein